MGLPWPSKVSRSYFSKNFLTRHFIREVQTLPLMFQKGYPLVFDLHRCCTLLGSHLLKGNYEQCKRQGKR
jgi:hypothetical protein